MSRRIICRLFILFFILPCLECDLILLQILYRHGDRSPVRIYPKDPYQESTWQDGLGELTKIGKQQEYHLGQYIRNHYMDNLNFLDKTFSVKDVYVRSTDVDRTLMSAYCMLAGLYPPTKNQTWNKNITWQPIPVHTVPEPEDRLLRYDAPCPTFDTKREYFMNHDPKILQLKKDTKDLVSYVAKNSGLPATFEGLMQILDTIYCEQQHNLTQPGWVMAGDTLERLNDLHNHYNAMLWFPTHELASMKGGTLLRTMYINMLTKITVPQNLTQKLMVYSAHDSTLAALLGTMKIFNELTPPYSSCVMMELHEDHTVRILYKNNTDLDQNITLVIPGCKEFCPLEQFFNLLNDSMVYDWNRACGLSNPEEIIFRNNVISYSVMGCIIFLLGLLAVFMCCLYNRQRQQYRYMEVPTDMMES